jgi:hypothetical protein
MDENLALLKELRKPGFGENRDEFSIETWKS